MADARRTGPAEGEPRYLTVATVRRPHGIRGELSLALETDHPEAVFRPGRTLVVGDSAGRPTGARLTVERARPFKDGLLLKPAEHSSLTEAMDALRGCSLLIPEAEAEPLAENEVFYHELVGMTVVAEGEAIGTVREVHTTAASDLLVIRRQGAGDLLVPFVREMIRGIRRDEGVLEIDPPAGLLDL